jgi:phosphate transport system permease protein
MKESLPKQHRLRKPFREGEHMVWLCGAALAACLLMIAGLLVVVAWNGMGIFWPHRLTQVETTEGGKILGIVTQTEDYRRPSGTNSPLISVTRSQIKVGNRDLYGSDFRWLDHPNLTNWSEPREAVTLERLEYGDFFGYLKEVKEGDKTVGSGEDAWKALLERHPKALYLAKQRLRIQKEEIGKVNASLQAAALRAKSLERRYPGASQSDAATAKLAQEQKTLRDEYDRLLAQVADLQREGQLWVAVFETADGRPKSILLSDIVRAFKPNQMGFLSKVWHYGGKVWEFVWGEPRESNTEGGIFPAIFGTVMMTLLMSVAVVPFGVLAAFYLREYATQGLFVRTVRIAVNNLAGVPSIVFGVFGLGFFVYFVGGTIDTLFYPDALPNPTFGTGGILWASLTLALLTVPVVIVATEESIAAVPRGAKEGSLALGASKFQTLCRIVLPASLPGILTGLILAMARGAGEVAPLMITGVVKLAPNLPLDGTFPFFHFDRKFMHLGFHIYDVGFQSPNVEAAKPMVFATTLLLLAVVVALNLVAIVLRDRIRKKYRTGAFA